MKLLNNFTNVKSVAFGSMPLFRFPLKSISSISIIFCFVCVSRFVYFLAAGKLSKYPFMVHFLTHLYCEFNDWCMMFFLVHGVEWGREAFILCKRLCCKTVIFWFKFCWSSYYFLNFIMTFFYSFILTWIEYVYSILVGPFRMCWVVPSMFLEGSVVDFRSSFIQHHIHQLRRHHIALPSISYLLCVCFQFVP